jgi:hypothetical protein
MDETLMDSATPLEDMARTLKDLYRSNPKEAGTAIEEYLQSSLRGLPPPERLHVVKNLRDSFVVTKAPPAPSEQANPNERLTELVQRVLGQEAVSSGLSTSESLEALAQSLNSVFDRLNEMVAVIQETLVGRRMELATIRQVIRSDLTGSGHAESIHDYLDHIKEAFLMASRAYTLAARTEIEKILQELDPEQISQSAGQGLKFGFMRKGEVFDVYQEKFGQFKRWFESERFSEDFAREFEKICRKLYAERGGAS